MNKLLMGACLTMAMQVGHSQTLPQLGKDPIEKIVASHRLPKRKYPCLSEPECPGSAANQP